MENVIELGLQNKVFSPQDVAELIFGKVITVISDIDVKNRTGIKSVCWEMRNCEVFDKDLRRKLLLEIRGRKDFNYDFVLPRIMCAIGYQCVAKEPVDDTEQLLINWNTTFSVKTPDIPNAHTLPLREILFWHNCEMPYTFEEVSLIQRYASFVIGTHQDWYKAKPESWRQDIEKGLSLAWTEITSGLLYYIELLIKLLIEMDYRPAPLPTP